jgi:hypothetical protein
MKIPVVTDQPAAGPTDQAEELPQSSPPPVRAPRKHIAPLTEEEMRVPEYASSESLAVTRVESHAPLPIVRISYALGIPCLGLSLIGFGLSWAPLVGLPLIGLLGLLLGGVGLLLGVAGLIVAIIVKGRGLSFSIAGLTFSLAALVVFFLVGLKSLIPSSVVEVTQQLTNEPKDLPASPDQSALPPAKEAEWVDVSKGPAQLGDVRVTIGWIVLGNVKIKNDVLGEERVSDKKYLCIQIFVQNLSEERKLDYRGWSGVEAAGPNLADLLGGAKDVNGLTQTLAGAAAYAATLTDENRNVYKRMKLDLGSYVVGQVVSEKSIYPKQRVEDLLVFEPPVEKAQFLRLELPAASYHRSGSIRLQIPSDSIRR